MNRANRVIRQSAILAASGHDVLFVSKDPEDDLGDGLCLLYGSMEEAPDVFLCIRRVLNELRAHLIEKGLELDFTITKTSKEEIDGR